MMITPKSLSSKMRSLPLSAALLLLTVIGVGSTSAATINGVGSDITTVPYTYDTIPGQGIPASTWPTYKADFRSTNTIAKTYVLPGNANAYGQDGYAFYGLASGTAQSNPSYISDISLVNPEFIVSGSFGNMDNPALSAGTYDPANTINYGAVVNNESDDVLTFTLSSSKSFRIGIMTGAKVNTPIDEPESLTLSGGGASATLFRPILALSANNTPDWYFFDINGSAGDVFTLTLESGNEYTSFSGVVFDTAAVPEPSTTTLLGLGIAACLQMARSRRRSAI